MRNKKHAWRSNTARGQSSCGHMQGISTASSLYTTSPWVQFPPVVAKPGSTSLNLAAAQPRMRSIAGMPPPIN
eukprot:CAMPEP_0176388258 /NCGR_PEP_ID=MMETSP0126-20121128/37438_1 /TAXON_ID=141414 ORGANISM="Strombidinopsis acuminatum, Strain SPMC142" /NCGR_SAMPLE_ID=MMETSP0126 /ASSEMBLY_ACC=CAM_ASM_000229 /LENGTH=72 /DNA_ID=CAMNT_0017756375 /DNA_START=126 /DNA_END=341 /DNA_ORIENTATION=+